jgi:polyhydroxyalkanoate synthesis regulator protein
LPIAFMRGLIGFYGDAMQELVSPNLERSMETLKLARLLPEKLHSTSGQNCGKSGANASPTVY